MDAFAHEILARLDRIEAAIAGTRKSKADRAKELGVSRTTLWRRQRRAAVASMAVGRRTKF